MGCALIRELHVYGVLQSVGARAATTMAPTTFDDINMPEAVASSDETAKSHKKPSQHGGFGRQLMRRAERIAGDAGYSKLAVISGVGVRNYYRRLGEPLSTSHISSCRIG